MKLVFLVKECSFINVPHRGKLAATSISCTSTYELHLLYITQNKFQIQKYRVCAASYKQACLQNICVFTFHPLYGVILECEVACYLMNRNVANRKLLVQFSISCRVTSQFKLFFINIILFFLRFCMMQFLKRMLLWILLNT